MAGLGEELRAAREARNLSLSEVSERIHIRSVYLQSLEEEDWSAIAAPVYVRGFLRTYARFLGLEPEEVVQRFNASLPAAGYDADEPTGRAEARSSGTGRAGRPTRRGPSIWLWVATAAAVVLVGFVGYDYYELQRDQSSGASVMETARPATTAAPTAPAAAETQAAGATREASTPVAAPSKAAANTVAVRLVQRSWLRVAVDGAVPMEGTYPAGTERVFHGKTATVRAGNAAGVDVTVNGRDVGTLGAPGDVVERTFTLAQE